MATEIKPVPLPDSYLNKDELFTMLVREEGTVAVPYNDGKGNATIGLGFNLTDPGTLAVVLNELGVPITTANVQLFQGVISDHPLTTTSNPPGGSSSEVALQEALNKALAGFASAAQVFTLDTDQDWDIFKQLILGYNFGGLYSSQGLQYTLDTVLGSLGQSQLEVTSGNGNAEFMALMSMYYNQPKLVGSSVKFALSQGDSAEVWYQIRYQSDANDPNGGIEKRRFYESQVFGMDGGTSSLTQAEQDYQTLTEHRGTILGKEAATVFQGSLPLQVGANPDAPNFTYTVLDEANSNYSLSGGSLGPVNASVQTLGTEFYGEGELIASDLDSLYGSVLPQISITNPSDFLSSAGGGSFQVSSTDIFVAASGGPGNMDVDAGAGDGTILGGAAEAAADHIVIGMTGGETLTGGLGDDIIVAGPGSETLNAGLGSDTLIGGSGNDVLNAGQGTDVLDLDFTQNPTPAFAVETVVDASGNGELYVDGSQIGNGTLTPSGNLTWTDGNYQYEFIPSSQIASGDLNGTSCGDVDWSPDVGELKITPTATNDAAVGTIDILGFNIAQAESSSGFLGIKLPETASLAGGAWIDPPALFPAGSEQAYTFSVDVPDTSAQTVTFTLSGASASDFEVQVGDTIEQLNSDGTFTVTLPAGESGVSFGLIDLTPDNGTSDIAAGTTLTLSASAADPDDPNGSPVQSSALSITYTPQPQDTTTASTSGDVISGTLSGGVTTYEGDGGDDYISAGQGANDNPAHRVRLYGRAVVAIALFCVLTACGRTSSPYDPSEIQPGERDYPVTNPHPTDILTIDVTIPPTLLVSITAIYLASPTAGGTMDSGMACQRTVGLAVTAPFSLERPVQFVQDGDRYTASVPIDGLIPGRCDWSFGSLNYTVRTRAVPPDRPYNELASYHSGGSSAVQTNIWCMRYPLNQKFRPEVCDSLDSLASDFPGEIPLAIVGAVPPSERKHGAPLMIGPQTTSMRIIFHDLDQLIRQDRRNRAPPSE